MYNKIVKEKETGRYGTTHYSTFGVSVHFYDEENNALDKTLGDKWENIKDYYEVLDEIPKGYEWDKSGLFIRRIRNHEEDA